MLNVENRSRVPGPASSPLGFGHNAETFGIHPLNAIGLIAIDFMLSTGEVITGGLFVLASLLVGAALVLPCTLVQRHAFGDRWSLALGKALLLGLLVGIPSPLPSALTAAWGITGFVGLRHRASHANVIDVDINVEH